MHAYVINLPRSRERREHMRTELKRAGISYDLIAAIDGRTLNLDNADLIDSSLRGAPWLVPGSVGNALSHLQAYQHILDQGYEHALVLEDDVNLPAGLAAILDSLKAHLTGAEVALLNYDSSATCKLSRSSVRRLSSGQELMLPLDASQPHSAAAYVVTQSFCKRMLADAPPIRVRVDCWGDYYSKGYADRVRCVYPMPVLKNPNFESTMARNPPKCVKSRILQLVSRYDIRLLQRLIAYRRERIWRSQIQVDIVDMPFISKPSRLD